MNRFCNQKSLFNSYIIDFVDFDHSFQLSNLFCFFKIVSFFNFEVIFSVGRWSDSEGISENCRKIG